VVKAGGPPVAKTCCKTAQQRPAFTHLLVQWGIKTIVPLLRHFHADADADSVSSTVKSPAYMYIENERIMYSSQMWHEMQTKQHFITNLISCLQIWVPRRSWPDPIRPVGRIKDRATLSATAADTCTGAVCSVLFGRILTSSSACWANNTTGIAVQKLSVFVCQSLR